MSAENVHVLIKKTAPQMWKRMIISTSMITMTCVLAVWMTTACRTVSRHSATEIEIDENKDVRIEETPVTAVRKTYFFKRDPRKKLEQLVVDGKLVIRESDYNSDGRVDAIRVRISDGRYIICEDTDGNGDFDALRKGP
jgi:hypothetical protein